MIDHYGKLIFIDLETTGPNPACDRITEIGIVEVARDEVRQWSTLVNPQVPIPAFVRRLTGIDDDMVRDAPTFDMIERELQARLEGGLFVAHNARFDYGFLRNAFRRLGTTLRCEVLCTVKLSRKLFPHEHKHGLDALMERHGLKSDSRHRAHGDADLLWQFWRTLETQFPAPALQGAVRELLQRSNLPEHVDPDLLDDIPDGPGVYVFYGENNVPLHVAKAAQLRQRVLSHFHAERPSGKDMLLARELRRIEWHETAGEIGAQLREAQLIRQLMPRQNARRQPGTCAWQLRATGNGGVRPVLSYACEQDFGRSERLYGLFNTRLKAEMALQAIAQAHALCLAELGLAPSGEPCHEGLKDRCGACTDSELSAEDAQRLEQALSLLKLVTWPYRGPVALTETGVDGRQDIHVLDNWCCLGTVHTEPELMQMLNDATAVPPFELETYRIVSRALAHGKVEVRPLEKHASNLHHA